MLTAEVLFYPTHCLLATVLLTLVLSGFFFCCFEPEFIVEGIFGDMMTAMIS